jgi:hypothetical protein
MKKILLALLCIVGTSVTLLAQKANGAAIQFDKEVHDYGELKNGANGTCEFRFKNTGNAPLIISDAKSSCGCVVPEWPKEPIKPGATAIIKVKYDTKRAGPISKTVTIYSNAINEPIKVIKVKGNVASASAEQPALDKQTVTDQKG